MFHIARSDLQGLAPCTCALEEASDDRLDETADGLPDRFETGTDGVVDGGEGAFDFGAGCVAVGGEGVPFYRVVSWRDGWMDDWGFWGAGK